MQHIFSFMHGKIILKDKENESVRIVERGGDSQCRVRRRETAREGKV